MSDKTKELNSSIKLVNNRLHFTGSAGSNDPVSIDYTAPLGDDLGYTSLELLLLSLSSCLGSAMLTFIRRMNRTITEFEITAKGVRKTEHPTGFASIHLEISLTSPDAIPEEVQNVIDLAEEKYCPVWSMIKGSTNVETSIKINNVR
ncbi:MAG TPA: OsmC family protein [Lentimicrobium sp.]|nr:OsmC family protein [Lentimicrobium sp.]